jgi:hypothetical protein
MDYSLLLIVFDKLEYEDEESAGSFQKCHNKKVFAKLTIFGEQVSLEDGFVKIRKCLQTRSHYWEDL